MADQEDYTKTGPGYKAALGYVARGTVPVPRGGKLGSAPQLADFAATSLKAAGADDSSDDYMGDDISAPGDPGDCSYCGDDGSSCPGCGSGFDYGVGPDYTNTAADYGFSEGVDATPY